MKNTEETERSPADICVLLLDSDATCLANLSEMLRKCGCRVVATTSADDLPRIINNKDEKIDLVLAEFRLIEMNKYELLKKIKSICEIPVVVAGAYVNNTVIFDCLFRGAKFFLTKPLMKRDLANLWQFTIRKERDFLTQIDTRTPSLGDELNNNNNEVKTEVPDEYKDEGLKRKERADLEDQKKPKLICADSEIKKNTEENENCEFENPELVFIEELEKWSTQPVTDFAAYVRYEFEERDFQPLESVGESTGLYEIPLSPRESSNKNGSAAKALDEELMKEDGISLSDLEFDMQEGQGSTSDSDKKGNQDKFNEIYTDFAKELKP